jgi:hypothetical protein
MDLVSILRDASPLPIALAIELVTRKWYCVAASDAISFIIIYLSENYPPVAVEGLRTAH